MHKDTDKLEKRVKKQREEPKRLKEILGKTSLSDKELADAIVYLGRRFRDFRRFR